MTSPRPWTETNPGKPTGLDVYVFDNRISVFLISDQYHAEHALQNDKKYSSRWIVEFFLWKESHFTTALVSSASDIGLGTLVFSMRAFANIFFPTLLSNIFGQLNYILPL